MRAVVQRVSRAKVTVGEAITGEIGRGLLLEPLLGSAILVGEAIAAAVDHRPDLYLIDLGMPRLDGVAVARYKRYANALTGRFDSDRSLALAANREVFSDPTNLERIVRFVESGIFPWEAS